MKNLGCAALLAGILGTLAGAAPAADSEPPARARAAPADKLGSARALIAAHQWPAALTELRRVNEPRSADWNNLMGYSLRHTNPPDYVAAERHYDEALRIDPRHRGALEYSGELQLMTGNLARAEERLATLAAICTTPCEEWTDLKQAVDRFKADGSKPGAR